MVVMSIEHYASLTESVESALDMADQMAAQTDTRLEHDEVFSDIRKRINGK